MAVKLACDCPDVEMHNFYASGGAFVRRWTLAATTPASKALRAGLNRYPHNVIGVYVSALGRGLTLNWKGSRLWP